MIKLSYSVIKSKVSYLNYNNCPAAAAAAAVFLGQNKLVVCGHKCLLCDFTGAMVFGQNEL